MRRCKYEQTAKFPILQVELIFSRLRLVSRTGQDPQSLVVIRWNKPSPWHRSVSGSVLGRVPPVPRVLSVHRLSRHRSALEEVRRITKSIAKERG